MVKRERSAVGPIRQTKSLKEFAEKSAERSRAGEQKPRPANARTQLMVQLRSSSLFSPAIYKYHVSVQRIKDEKGRWAGFPKEEASADSGSGATFFHVPPGEYKIRAWGVDKYTSKLFDVSHEFRIKGRQTIWEYQLGSKHPLVIRHK